jgi:hypothetical protein
MSMSFPYVAASSTTQPTYRISHLKRNPHMNPLTHSKAVPLHAMVTLGGRGHTVPTHSWPWHWMDVSGQRHAPAALCFGERTPGTHYTRGWVGLRAGLDKEVRGKILCPCRGSNLDRPDVQSVARHYTDWALTHKTAKSTAILNTCRRMPVLLDIDTAVISTVLSLDGQFVTH